MSDQETANKLLPVLEQACKKYPQSANKPIVIIKLNEQKLYLFKNNQLDSEYYVSTSRFGSGQEIDSNQTPLGIHCIQEKIGAGAEFGEILSSRQRTHKKAKIEHEAVCTNEEYVTSRILWLAGLEEGFNKGTNDRGKCVDSYERYIYIHGTHEEGLIRQAASIGCVRMKNTDVVELFDQLAINSLVIIKE